MFGMVKNVQMQIRLMLEEELEVVIQIWDALAVLLFVPKMDSVNHRRIGHPLYFQAQEYQVLFSVKIMNR